MKWLWRNAIPLSLLGGVILFTQRGEEVTDRLRLMNYQPPDAIAYLAEATTMTGNFPAKYLGQSAKRGDGSNCRS
jgi:hypothetical protein